ncbi:MAG TPA: glutathione S-transferase, partial [Gammaproteobacteria bacterium]|nr:glutathione S-transferase [Gammaproteobacteria bacterium]
GSELLPQDRYARAQVLQRLVFEQYSHEPFITSARYINKYLGLSKEREAGYHAKQEGGDKALGIMEQRLTDLDWLMGNNMTIADFTLYA